MRILKCRICGKNQFIDLFSLGKQPPANNFLSSTEQEVEFYPLDVRMCDHCKLVQLSDRILAEKLFSNYNYIPSVSKNLDFHFQLLAKQIWKRYKLKSDDLIVDIGSNDGLLLGHFRSLNAQILGIEPASNIAGLAKERGIPTINSFFNATLAKQLIKTYGKAKIITATNVLAHVHNIKDFINGVEIFLDEDGVFIAEFPYLADLIQKNEFDTIYHEHLSYFSLKPLVYLFSNPGLNLFDVETTSVHGGSIVIYASKKEKQVGISLKNLLAREEEFKLHDKSTYSDFFKRISSLASKLREHICAQKSMGRKIIGIGAAAKGTILLNFTGLDSTYIEYVVDNTPYKQGKFIPGVNIQIFPEGKMYTDKPDIALILAWNHQEEIISKHSQLLKDDRKFIIPIPNLKIIS